MMAVLGATWRKQFEAFATQSRGQKRDAGDVAAGPVVARDQTVRDQIVR